ncbi:caspase family protein [Streptomyces sp. DSM 44917]|uniref:Caspase family protein n=1 Tax=Streptomyces boetiae TaxID=3075541 RepID=A0ABU2LCL2_9ACTN|nr:caspase family protein [Streptomyces sp. DSM 44917]MDT0309252.1 caspase family protein [Streptomyces sp. DSM 44917]
MATVHALLVGIDDYSALDRPRLGGCLNDIAAVEGWLRRRAGGRLRLRVLREGEATRAAVAEGIREHLGAAGAGDTALLWYSGHGTESEVREAGDERREATGRYQALACADLPLVDRELGALLDGAAARGGHVVAVLDCCFAGGGTREERLTARSMPPAPAWGALAGALPEAPGAGARDAAGPDGDGRAAPRHLLLAASRLYEKAWEDTFGERRHGLFTYALLGVLGSGAYEGATYREVLAAAHARVRRATAGQHPVLHPDHPGGPADLPFLGAAGVRRPSPHLLRFGPDGWEVDCGGAHGLRDGGAQPRAEGVEFTVTARPEGRAGPGGGEVRSVRVTEVRAERALVRPGGGWAPDPERTYPVALSALPLPPAAVSVEPPAPGDPAAEWLRGAVRSAGPGGGPSPLLCGDGGRHEPEGLLLLRVLPRGGRAHVLRRDGTPFLAPLPLSGPGDARRVAEALVHLARWHQIRDLENPAATLGSPVRVEVTPVAGHEDRLLPGDGSRELVCAYARGAEGWLPPLVTVRLHNRSSRRLWCVLLNLTDSYRSHSLLFPGDWIGPGRSGYALGGDPVELSLPASREPRPGAEVRDWLTLLVAEGEVNTLPFHLDAWDPAAPGHRGAAAAAGDGVLRLAPPARADRDAGPAAGRPASPGQWTTYTLALRTVVPS